MEFVVLKLSTWRKLAEFRERSRIYETKWDFYHTALALLLLGVFIQQCITNTLLAVLVFHFL